MVTLLLGTPPEDAVTVIVPFAPVVPVAVTTPADTVAICVLLEVHWATLVMSTAPLQVFAVAVSETLVFPPLLRVPLVGCTEMEPMHPTVTVTV
jgi:hypothetical protein